ncbi:MAG TPA: argininosuccinate lyase, partial [Acidimicrobiia bacterium]|nr:argininosuccinate lyase [Acidimicrobiia bacterium]
MSPEETTPGGTREAKPLWHGRFTEGPADDLMRFTESLSFDRRLAGDDITGSRAHVRMLARAGLLTKEEERAVLAALDQVEAEITED